MEKIQKMAIKYPFTSIAVFIGMFVPYFLAVLLFNPKNVSQLGIIGISITAATLSLLPAFIWGLVHGMTIKTTSREVLEDGTIIFNESLKSWPVIIAVSALSNGFWSFIFLAICYFFDLNFTWFFLLSGGVSIARLAIISIQHKFYFNRKK